MVGRLLSIQLTWRRIQRLRISTDERQERAAGGHAHTSHLAPCRGSYLHRTCYILVYLVVWPLVLALVINPSVKDTSTSMILLGIHLAVLLTFQVRTSRSRSLDKYTAP
jgi:hypothetical protein